MSGSFRWERCFARFPEAKRDDVIFDIAVQTTKPSYGNQVANGATSLTEDWDGAVTGLGSQNHMMFGAIDEWFTSGLAGIRQAPGDVGYRSLVIQPAVVGDLTHVYGSYKTPNGLVESEWTVRYVDKLNETGGVGAFCRERWRLAGVLPGKLAGRSPGGIFISR